MTPFLSPKTNVRNRRISESVQVDTMRPRLFVGVLAVFLDHTFELPVSLTVESMRKIASQEPEMWAAFLAQIEEVKVKA